MKDLDLPALLSEDLEGLSVYVPPGGNQEVKLDANESPFPPDPFILKEIEKAFGEVDLNRYPDPASKDLREAFARRFGCGTETVMAGNGSDELIGYLTWTLKGRRSGVRPAVVVPVPTFPLYSHAARAAGYDVHEVPLGPGMEPDMEGLLRKIGEAAPSIVFISSPNNPTGTVFSREDIDAVCKASAGLVVVDEAYGDYSEEESRVPEAGSPGNLAVLRTLSKVGAAAARCGFLAAGRGLLDQIDKVRFPFNLSRYSQVAGKVVLDNYGDVRSRVEEVIRERDRLAPALAKAGLEIFPSGGNFLMARCGGREEAFYRFLTHGGIVVKFLPDITAAGNALRITVGTRRENDLLISRTGTFFKEGGVDAKG